MMGGMADPNEIAEQRRLEQANDDVEVLPGMFGGRAVDGVDIEDLDPIEVDAVTVTLQLRRMNDEQHAIERSIRNDPTWPNLPTVWAHGDNGQAGMWHVSDHVIADTQAWPVVLQHIAEDIAHPEV